MSGFSPFAPVIELLARAVVLVHRYPTVRRAIYKRGLDVVDRHYYSPIPDEADFGQGFWERESELIGLTIDGDRMLRLLRNVFAVYLPEFRERFPLEKKDAGDGFYLINGRYMAVDAHVYYCLIRHHKPRRIIEIGSGESTRVAVAAVEVNRSKDDAGCTITAIEPYPKEFLSDLARTGVVDLMQEKVQDVKLNLFETLAENDLLFIDSTHVLREGNDVQYEYLDILPRLRPGVLVHIHDVSLPRKYPKVYFERKLYWNEQYLLQAYLTYNSRVKVLWPGNWMMLRYPGEMHEVFPEINVMREHYPSSEPSAFWFQTKMD